MTTPRSILGAADGTACPTCGGPTVTVTHPYRRTTARCLVCDPKPGDPKPAVTPGRAFIEFAESLVATSRYPGMLHQQQPGRVIELPDDVRLPPIAPGQLRCQRCAQGVASSRARFCPDCSHRARKAAGLLRRKPGTATTKELRYQQRVRNALEPKACNGGCGRLIPRRRGRYPRGCTAACAA